MLGTYKKSSIFWLLTGIFSISICTLAIVHELRSRQQIDDFLSLKLKQIITKMPLEAKVGQLFHIGIEGTQVDIHTIKQLQKYRVGGVILFAYNLNNPSQIRRMNTDLQAASIEASGIPLLISTDQEGGSVTRLDSTSSVHFPSAMALGQAGNPDYVKEAAFITGYELRQLGINWVLAPVLDVNNNAHNPVINVRSFGPDPKLVARMGMAYVAGNRQALSISTIKHFPGHGDTDVDSHLALPRIDKSLSQMEKVEFLPFRKLIQEGGAEVLMTAHILFPSLDAKRPATLSPKIISDLLRRQMGFKGMVTTDAMEMDAIAKRYPPAQAARLAFQAGADVLLVTKRGKMLSKMYSALVRDFQNQRLDVTKLNQAIKRQLDLKLRKGLFHRWDRDRDPQSAHVKTVIYAKKDAYSQHLQELEKKAKKHYEALQQKYQSEGVDLNTRIARKSITALGRPFSGLQLKDLSKVRLLAASKVMGQEAMRMGIAMRHIYDLKGSADIINIISKRKPGEIWFIEIKPHFINAWNKLIQSQKKNEDLSIALYTGNPFAKNLKLPKYGAVLLSYSNTPSSQMALIYRGLHPQKPILQAQLSFPTKPLSPN